MLIILKNKSPYLKHIILRKKALGGLKLTKRNRHIVLILIILLLTACTQDRVYSTLVVDDFNGIDLEEINRYEMDVLFNPDNKTYQVNQEVLYVNNSKAKLSKVYFHLYPNAYKKLETAPILFQREVLSKGYAPGYIEIEEINVDGKQVDFSIEGEGETILKIDLPKKLNPGEKIKIHFKYMGKLPKNIDRFGYGDDVFNFGNWYPIACVYDDTGWNLDPYYSLGDPFYSDIANYDVKITVPKDMVVAASGNIVKETINRGKKTYIIEGRLIRDFAWVASFDFVVEEVEADNTVIKLYALEDDPNMASFALEVGKKSMEVFNSLFGDYPYGVYSIVMTEFPTGMEYPGIVFINREYYNENSKDDLEQVIVHETAHQWWYGVVGNDQIDEAWLDESLATYSEIIYMYHVYGGEQAENYYQYHCQMPYEYVTDYLDLNVGIKKSLDQFNGWDDYGFLVYTKGAVFLNSIKEDFGMETLCDILSSYYKTYRFHNTSTEDFIKICEKVTSTSFQERANEWIYHQ